MKAAWFAATLRSWSWRQFWLGLLVGSLTLYNMGGLPFYFGDMNLARAWTYNVSQFGWPYVFALGVADRAVDDGVARWKAYSVMVPVVILVGVWVIGPLLSPLLGGESWWTDQSNCGLAFSQLLPFALATLGYAHWRREHLTLSRLQETQLARARQRQLVESQRLLALQARVESRLLFDALHRVRALIERSSAEAEASLADVITLLRALQPAAGATTSSVERELALVRAYAQVSQWPALQAPRLQWQVSDEAGTARLAPLVLLPLLRAAIGDAPHSRWTLSATRDGERLHLALAPAERDPHALTSLLHVERAPLIERLRAVHGTDASLVLDANGPTPSLRVDTAFQAADIPVLDADDNRPDRRG